jgi:hypothetical protein
MAELDDGLQEMGEPPASATPQELATLLVETFWTVLVDLRAELDALTPPSSVAAEHGAFTAVLDDALAIQDQLLAAITRTAGDDPWMLFDSALRDVAPGLPDRLVDTCRDLEQHSVVRGGPELCGLLGE